MIDLDPTEKDILMALQERGKEFLRPDIAALAEELGCEKEYVQNTLKKLEDKQVIENYTASIDDERLGFLTLFVDFDIDGFSLDCKIADVEKFKNTGDFSIVAAYVITGDKDIHLEVKVRGIEGYKSFVRQFSGISAVGTACGTLGYQKIDRKRIIELRYIVETKK
jgi:DNA-binding Lrp family transcriptional regulator